MLIRDCIANVILKFILSHFAALFVWIVVGCCAHRGYITWKANRELRNDDNGNTSGTHVMADSVEMQRTEDATSDEIPRKKDSEKQYAPVATLENNNDNADEIDKEQ